jgi:hypothetical protein
MILLSAILYLSFQVSYSQPEVEKVPRDTIDLGDYQAILFEIYIPDGKGMEKNSEELYIFKDGKPAMTTHSITVYLHNFGSESDTSKETYHKDINNDGIDEIIVTGHTGLGSCCNHVSIHSLKQEYIDDLGRFELRDLNVFYFEDIDNDSVPEILHSDPHFLRWKAPFDDSPRPLLIWKWYKTRYRLANLKHADYMLARITPDNIKSLEKAMVKWGGKEYNADDEYKRFPPSILWGMMLDYIYAGRAEAADSLYDYYWPDKIPGKEDFYKEFKSHYENGFYWPGVLNSEF